MKHLDNNQLLNELQNLRQRELVAPYLPVSEQKRERVKTVAVQISSQPIAPLFEVERNVPSRVEIVHDIRFQVTEDEMKLLLQLKSLSGAATVKDALVKAARQYRDRHSPEERMKRRMALMEKRANRKAVDLIEEKSTATVAVNRAIPASTRDAVRVRDEQRCTFVGAGGQRCSEHRHLQIDHVKPFAFGGDHQTENLRLLCTRHHRLVSERTFGEKRGNSSSLRPWALPTLSS